MVSLVIIGLHKFQHRITL